MLSLWASVAFAMNDPHLKWRTIETTHFRITYPSQGREVAEHVADVAESIYGTMSHAVGWKPREITEILLTDGTDNANGSATALPYNAIRLYMTAPDDLSPLGEVDDWYLELVTHEFTHILHTDHIRGIPALVNAIVGKTMSPNSVQPRWLLEGLAVFEESERTSGGRLRSSVWNMYMRTDVLENNIATLDQVSNSVRRWPQGTLYYLYGSFFLNWIADTYGEAALRYMADDYGSQLVPWGFNRSIRRATGKTFEQLYPEWVRSMQQSYFEDAARVRNKGIREGTRITRAGQIARYPRWIPKGAWPGFVGGLLYYRDDTHSRAGLYAMPIQRDARGAIVHANENERELMARTAGESAANFFPDGSFVFNSTEVHKNVFSFDDLFYMPAGATSPSGLDGVRTRLTEAFRASDPALSPDGRRIAFVSNHRGTRWLQIANITPNGVSDVHSPIRGDRFDQVFTPRWSPDGRTIAFSTWKRGGYRDIHLLDVATGAITELTHDRAQDGGPSFSADGRYLFFHSDRTGIMNIFAWDFSTRTLFQVTNVLGGAHQPEPSPDGKTLAYVGYTKEGFDLYAMAIDPSEWFVASPYEVERPPLVVPTRLTHYEEHDFNSWQTMRPRKYSVQIAPGNFGQAATIGVEGADIVGIHSARATMTTELERADVRGALAYTYGRLPFDMSASMFRTIAPRTGYSVGSYTPTVIEENVGVATAIGYSKNAAFQSQDFSVSYSASRVAQKVSIPIEKYDPYETPSLPRRGFLGQLHLSYAFSNAEKYLRSVSGERGFSFALSIDLTDPALASDYRGYSTSTDFTTYLLMPWLSHHALALHAGAGASGGNFPGSGAFYVGGFVDAPIVDTIRYVAIQGGILLRGYEPVALTGRYYSLFNAEYRFPIVNVDRGPSTLPGFLNRINGTVFVDYGSAFDSTKDAQFKTGVGAEVSFEMTLGYIVPFIFRLGFASGLASGGLDKGYFVAAVPY